MHVSDPESAKAHVPNGAPDGRMVKQQRTVGRQSDGPANCQNVAPLRHPLAQWWNDMTRDRGPATCRQ